MSEIKTPPQFKLKTSVEIEIFISISTVPGPGTHAKILGHSVMPRPSSSRLSTATTPAHVKSRQFSHLNSQLAQLQAHLADLDNHVRITAIQAEAMKRLGAQHASMYVHSHSSI
jgi:DASH complex subunit Hsk3 like